MISKNKCTSAQKSVICVRLLSCIDRTEFPKLISPKRKCKQEVILSCQLSQFSDIFNWMLKLTSEPPFLAITPSNHLTFNQLLVEEFIISSSDSRDGLIARQTFAHSGSDTFLVFIWETHLMCTVHMQTHMFFFDTVWVSIYVCELVQYAGSCF